LEDYGHHRTWEILLGSIGRTAQSRTLEDRAWIAALHMIYGEDEDFCALYRGKLAKGGSDCIPEALLRLANLPEDDSLQQFFIRLLGFDWRETLSYAELPQDGPVPRDSELHGDAEMPDDADPEAFQRYCERLQEEKTKMVAIGGPPQYFHHQMWTELLGESDGKIQRDTPKNRALIAALHRVYGADPLFCRRYRDKLRKGTNDAVPEALARCGDLPEDNPFHRFSVKLLGKNWRETLNCP
jgi:hypothetical protein